MFVAKGWQRNRDGMALWHWRHVHISDVTKSIASVFSALRNDTIGQTGGKLMIMLAAGARRVVAVIYVKVRPKHLQEGHQAAVQ